MPPSTTMNAHRDLHTLMREIRLPEHLAPQPGRGPVHWYVRAVWEEYSGWFMLISTDRELQTINAMPRMTAFPIHIAKVASGRAPVRTQVLATDDEDALAI